MSLETGVDTHTHQNTHPVLHQLSQGPHAVPKQFADRQEGRHQDGPSEAEERREFHRGARADRAPKDENAILPGVDVRRGRCDGFLGPRVSCLGGEGLGFRVICWMEASQKTKIVQASGTMVPSPACEKNEKKTVSSLIKLNSTSWMVPLCGGWLLCP